MSDDLLSTLLFIVFVRSKQPRPGIIADRGKIVSCNGIIPGIGKEKGLANLLIDRLGHACFLDQAALFFELARMLDHRFPPVALFS